VHRTKAVRGGAPAKAGKDRRHSPRAGAGKQRLHPQRAAEGLDEGREIMALPPVDRQIEDAIQAINYALGIIVKMTVDDKTYPMVAAQEGELWDVRNRVSFILMRIREKQETVQ
jgi:hypothetical protein